MTHSDDTDDAIFRTVPNTFIKRSMTLSDASPGDIILPCDVKSCSITNKGPDPVLANVSRITSDPGDSIVEDYGDLTDDDTRDQVHELAKGESLPVIQNNEFNRIHGRVKGGTGDAVVVAHPGKGFKNGHVEGVTYA